MDLLSTATTFANLGSLLGTYSAEQRNDDAASFEEFLQWLIVNNHKELTDLLQQDSATAVSIKALLNGSRNDLLFRLKGLDESAARWGRSIDQNHACQMAGNCHAS